MSYAEFWILVTWFFILLSLLFNYLTLRLTQDTERSIARSFRTMATIHDLSGRPDMALDANLQADEMEARAARRWWKPRNKTNLGVDSGPRRGKV